MANIAHFGSPQVICTHFGTHCTVRVTVVTVVAAAVAAAGTVAVVLLPFVLLLLLLFTCVPDFASVRKFEGTSPLSPLSSAK